MQSDKTFSTRSNAKRNAIRAGVAADSIEIVSHGKGDNVRFGWRKARVQTATTVAKPKAQIADTKPAKRETRNGVKRPREGTKCRAVWDWLDKNPGISIKDAKAAAPKHGFNVNNLVAEYYQRRKWTNVG